MVIKLKSKARKMWAKTSTLIFSRRPKDTNTTKSSTRNCRKNSREARQAALRKTKKMMSDQTRVTRSRMIQKIVDEQEIGEVEESENDVDTSEDESSQEL